MKKTNPFKQLKEIIKENEKRWQKDIDNEKNPILKIFKQDLKDLSDIQAKFLSLEAKYGIRVKIEFPKHNKKIWKKNIK